MEHPKDIKQINLGTLIELLKPCHTGKVVYFTFGGFYPTVPSSYRGWYDHLALEYSNQVSPPSVATLLKRLQDAVGTAYTGWKGGEYTMYTHTPVWADNPGDGYGVAIIGVEETDNCVFILTQHNDLL